MNGSIACIKSRGPPSLEELSGAIAANLKAIQEPSLTDQELENLEERTSSIASNLKYIEENSYTDSEMERWEEQTGNIASNLKYIEENGYSDADLERGDQKYLEEPHRLQCISGTRLRRKSFRRHGSQRPSLLAKGFRSRAETGRASGPPTYGACRNLVPA
jgi:hypothetical protein